MESEKCWRQHYRVSSIQEEDIKVIMIFFSLTNLILISSCIYWKKYEKYQTEESVNEKSNYFKILRGDKKTVPLSVFGR